MNSLRKREIHELVEACHHTDNTDLDSEKTAVIEELLVEVEMLECLIATGVRDGG